MSAVMGSLAPRWVIGRRQTLQIAGIVAAVVLAKIVTAVLADHGVIRAATPWPTVLLGAILGMTYGLLAVGLVLVFRTNRIINFAHGQIGVLGATFFALADVKWRFPYWVAFPAALLVASAAGAVTETAAVRRLRNAPRLMSIVVTLGIGQFLLLFAAIIDPTASAGSLFPQPSGLPVFNVGALRVTQAYSGMLILSPVVVVAIAVFLKRSRFGLAMRAASANPDAARMAGIFAGRMSSLAWAIAGGLSAFTAILTAPTLGFVGGDVLGPGLLLRAMTAGVIARMQNLPVALAAGVGIGVIEQLLLWNYGTNSGLVEVVLFVVILVALLLQRQHGGREEDKGSWAAVQALRPLPQQIRSLTAVRMSGPVLVAVLFGVLAVLPALISNSASQNITQMMCFAMVGLSVGVLTGLGGQLTLGQFAIAAIGAVISFQVSRRIGDFPLAFLYAGLGAGLVSVLIGLPALRIRGLMLTVTTLGFALATSAWLLIQPWTLSKVGREPGAPRGWPFSRALDTGHRYYYFALVVFALVFVFAWNVRRSGFGRLLVAVRDNEDNARAFTVRASRVKLQGYLVAGLIAGVAGATYAHSLTLVNTSTFPISANIDVVVMPVLGGIATLAGPILGVLWVQGLPLLNVGNLALAGSYLGMVGVILWKPGGLIELIDPLRLRVITALARMHGVDARPLLSGGAVTTDDGDQPAIRPVVSERVPVQRAATVTTTLLEARHLSKRFGGIAAVRDVSFAVRARETVGLIGPNGAGKTTTFELLGGFTRPDAGHVVFNRRDISASSPEARAQLGLIRSFQDAALFPTMTVHDTLMLALERSDPTRLLASLVGWSPSDRGKRQRADDLVAAMGLGAYRDKQIRELSTGTRRIAEIACLVALDPVCLLLDEPSSGIAQRETEALGELLTDLKNQLDLTLVVIEHDIPLIMEISDRIIAMADGVVIAEGAPDAVRIDAAVVDAYLGGKVEAIERSGRRSRKAAAK